MASWIHKPAQDEFVTDSKQMQFTIQRRIRNCLACHQPYIVARATMLDCPTCGGPGRRKFNYMTIFAGRRYGKTMLGAMSCYDEACIPGTIGWACAPTIKALNRFIIPAFQQVIRPEIVKHYNSQFGDLWLKNGSLIHFQTLDNPDDGRGQGLDWCWIDEACILTETHWDTIAPSLAGDTIALCTTTPKSFDWVHDRFWEPAERGDPGFWAMQAHSADSPNPRITPEWLAKQRAQMGDEWYRQEFEADFVNFQGAIYSGTTVTKQVLRDDEDVRVHIPEWPKLNPWRPVYIGVDTGADHPFGAVKIVATDHALIVVEDYLERHRPYIEHAAELKRLAGPNPAYYCINKNERQPMIELARHGVNCQLAENEQLAGTERVKSWLYQGNLYFVESRVPRTVKQMLALRHAEARTDDQHRGKLIVYKRKDELPDCVRYACMGMPILPPDPQVQVARDISHFNTRRQDDIARAQAWEQRKQNKQDPKSLTFDLSNFYG